MWTLSTYDVCDPNCDPSSHCHQKECPPGQAPAHQAFLGPADASVAGVGADPSHHYQQIAGRTGGRRYFFGALSGLAGLDPGWSPPGLPRPAKHR
jgi:hypothetical protein